MKKKPEGRVILAHVVLIILSFMCLFFFYILIINATRSHAQLQMGFSALTAYGIYAYEFRLKKAAFTFIMAILVMPTQVTALGFLRLITKMGMDDSLLPLILPSVASPAVFYFMHSYMLSSLPNTKI